MKKLTNQQMAVIELVSQGIDELAAVERAYNCGSKDSAYAIKSKLFKQKLFKEELDKIADKRRDKLADKGKKITDFIDELISGKEIAEIIVRNAKSEDKRMSDLGVDKILKLKAAYPPTSLGIFRDLEKERTQVLTEGEAAKQIENPELERLPVIEMDSAAKEKKE